MINYQQNSIWQRTLARQLGPDIYENQREFLRVEFENFREKAKILSGEISSVLPNYTVHSIEHIDALWDTAEMFVPKDYNINPAEAFVLGGAFLLHDLGMALASYPKGIEELKKEQMWIDTAAALRREFSNGVRKTESEIETIATERTLRLQHARKAGELATLSWKNSQKQDVFLIDNVELRSSFGHIIGLIAYSHWWSVNELAEKLPSALGALSRFDSGWTIDPLKLACILRIADAMQIDDRRSPSFLRIVRLLPYSAELHWNFQEKLYQPRIEQNRIIYTSKSPFSVNEVDSWWTCFDTLKMIDNELNTVDSLLSSLHKERFKAIGISSIDDPKKLSKLITVIGWQPIDTNVKVSNVAKLVNSIGGIQLYGKNMIVPLRELIQNASDAIRARKIIENENDEFGNIYVRIGEDETGEYIEVEDNGIGMSQTVLTGPFLDFGQSFWGTDLMHEELPGLESKGFCSTGKYGIGFFSLFMWSNNIKVTTNRYNNGRADTIILEFKDGAFIRPTFREATESEYIRYGGTKIRVRIDENIISSLLSHNNKQKPLPNLSELIKTICPSMDCNIYVQVNDENKLVIKANDWISMSEREFLKRVWGSNSYREIRELDEKLVEIIANNIELIYDEEGIVVGRAALFCDKGYNAHLSINGAVSIGGFRSSELSGIVGILDGYPERASRDIGIPKITMPILTKWLQSQENKLSEICLDENLQLHISSILRYMGISPKKLKIAENRCGCMNFDEIKNYLKNELFDEYIVVQDAAIYNLERNTLQKIDFHKNVVWTASGTPCILQTGQIDYFDSWPTILEEDDRLFRNRTLSDMVLEAMADAWDCSIDELYNSSDIASDELLTSACIGRTIEGDIVLNHVDIISRPQKSF